MPMAEVAPMPDMATADMAIVPGGCGNYVAAANTTGGAEGIVVTPEGTLYFSQAGQGQHIGRIRPGMPVERTWVQVGPNVLGITYDPKRKLIYAGRRGMGTASPPAVLKIDVSGPRRWWGRWRLPPPPSTASPWVKTRPSITPRRWAATSAGSPTSAKPSLVNASPLPGNPNGLAFGPDGKLYIVYFSGNNQVTRLTLTNGGETGREVFLANVGAAGADGIAFDDMGRLYVTAGGQLRRIRAPAMGAAQVDMMMASNGANIEFGVGALSCNDVYVGSGNAGIRRHTLADVARRQRPLASPRPLTIIRASDMIDWQQVHDQFPINRQADLAEQLRDLRHARAGAGAMQAHLQALAEGGVTGVPSEEAVHASARARLARLIGADVDELTLIHHTAEGLTFISHGLDLAPGDRLVVLEHEYPSNVYPWQHWQGRGVQLVFAPLADTPEQFLDGLRPLLQPPTRVVSLSAVHWCTGMPLPLVEIGRLCAERDVLLVVDGAQGVGLVDIDVRAAGIAAMAFSAWKWLLGPIGLGALYLRRDLIDRLRFPFKGTGSVIDDHNHLPYRDALKPGADRYVLSTPNYNDWVHFDASLEYLEGLGLCGGARTNSDAGRPARRSLRAAGCALAS